MNNIIKVLVFIISISAVSNSHADKAVFAGGCFWCVEAAYQDVDGVTAAVSGFIGGTLKNPTYSGNHKGHYEAVEITYDPAIISYQQLLDLFWINIDPFDGRGQFCDKGLSYRSAIFVVDEAQQPLATASRAKVVGQFPDQQVITPILPANKFWPVEEYHQDYYLKNPLRYKYYRYGCGRDARLKDIWSNAQNP
jgi:peptide-methionine (S)-S-oxide reductase|tara:strand:+ start:2839 stop:3420 length:582 start_codon:yes stop_codon:yes gene_type:complete